MAFVIAIAISSFDEYRDRDRDLNFDDRGHALIFRWLFFIKLSSDAVEITQKDVLLHIQSYLSVRKLYSDF